MHVCIKYVREFYTVWMCWLGLWQGRNFPLRWFREVQHQSMWSMRYWCISFNVKSRYVSLTPEWSSSTWRTWKTPWILLWQETTLANSQVLLKLSFMNGVWLEAPWGVCFDGKRLYLAGSMAACQKEFKHIMETKYLHWHAFIYGASASTPRKITCTLEN